MRLTLSPAYGRDYKSKAAVQKDWDEGKDFIIETLHHPDCGRPMNKEQVSDGEAISIRYKVMTAIMNVA